MHSNLLATPLQPPCNPLSAALVNCVYLNALLLLSCPCAQVCCIKDLKGMLGDTQPWKRPEWPSLYPTLHKLGSMDVSHTVTVTFTVTVIVTVIITPIATFECDTAGWLLCGAAGNGAEECRP